MGQLIQAHSSSSAELPGRDSASRHKWRSPVQLEVLSATAAGVQRWAQVPVPHQVVATRMRCQAWLMFLPPFKTAAHPENQIGEDSLFIRRETLATEMRNEPIKDSCYRGTHLAFTREHLFGSQTFRSRINKNLFSFISSRKEEEQLISFLVKVLLTYHSVVFKQSDLDWVWSCKQKFSQGLFSNPFKSIYKCSIVFKSQLPCSNKLKSMFSCAWHRKWRNFMWTLKTHFYRQSRLRKHHSKGSLSKLEGANREPWKQHSSSQNNFILIIQFAGYLYCTCRRLKVDGQKNISYTELGN